MYACIVELPFKNEGKGSNDSSGKGMSVDNQNIVAHASIERDFGNNIHSSIPKLQ